ncbi:MAG TPA: prepilin-type N-terminal cleavage/methylation domain-containing protein [Verrucomicrobiae bacterium]|nr:prepilin-type N-terminal cleavage/methylation domain-containing protein [Verrucomicrobiae bacterium]
MHTNGKRRAGFTLTELLVLIGVGSVLAGLLVADLNQTKVKFYQQACAGTLKQWGLVIDLYTQDYDGHYFYAYGIYDWSDVGGYYGGLPNPYMSYLAGPQDIGSQVLRMRTMRQCPFINQFYSETLIEGGDNGIGYSLAKPQAKGINGDPNYIDCDSAYPSPYVISNSTLPSLKDVRKPAEFLLLMDGGNSLSCGHLVNLATTIPTHGPPIKPIDRHGGYVNCLFGDQHVELVSAQTLTNQDAMGGCGNSTGNPWFRMN